MNFKSERAAKLAMTKANKAYDEAIQARNAYSNEPGGWNEERFAGLRKLEQKMSEAYEAGKKVYDAARAQGFWVHSYHFGHNPTRDLIAANMD